MKKDVDFQDGKDEDRHMKTNMTSLEQWKLQHSIRRTAKMVAQAVSYTHLFRHYLSRFWVEKNPYAVPAMLVPVYFDNAKRLG